ncbi:MAG TPA: YceI family protein [Acidimicrobiales bacterium]|nr:YceI family protein [Acidimicrobiales bacterium]
MTDPEVPQTEKSSRSKAPLIVGGLVVVAIVVAGVFWLLRDDAPDEVNLDDAVAQVSTTTEAADTGDTGDTGSDDGSSTTEVAADGIEGEWTVDTETGEFDYESATGSFVGFRIDEELAGVGATEAVGRTGDVSGGITIEGTTVTAGSFDVDLTTIPTNESRRDDRVQSALATDQFPTATFELTGPIELGAGAADGETVTATAVGDLTIKGTTQSIEMPIEAKLVEGTVVLVGSSEITFADFGVEVPSAPIVLSVADVGTLELQLLLVRG